jgi:N-acetylmuramoyl-L-alanine amidase
MSNNGEGRTISAGSNDSVTSIAEDHGFFWETIWNHGSNAQLKSEREDPNIIKPGDEVFVPKRRERWEDCAVDQRHEFKRRGVPAMLKLRLTKLDKPRANEQFVLEIDGEQIEGATDGQGKLEVPIPPNARYGKLILRDGAEVYPLNIGQLDPYDSPTGVQQRLKNMGFYMGSIDGDLEKQETVDAIKAFQAREDLPVTGEADEMTINVINDTHI